MTNTPTTKPAPSAAAKLNAYRYGGAAAAMGIIALLEWFAAGWPPVLRQGIEVAIGALYGKFFGVPLKEVFELSLRRNPAAALQVATTALASLPPERTEAALASLPPDMRLRVSVIPNAPTNPNAPGMIIFTNASEYPEPIDPTGAPVVRTSPPSVANTNDVPALRSVPMPEGGHGFIDTDLATGTAGGDAPGAAENTRPTRPRR